MISKPQPIEYKDFISILLTTLAVTISLTAFNVAILGVFGYQLLKKEMTQDAIKAAQRRVDETVYRRIQQLLSFDRRDGEQQRFSADDIATAFAKDKSDDGVRRDKGAPGRDASSDNDDHS